MKELRITIRLDRRSEEILKSLKQHLRGLFVDEATAHFAMTPEGREKIERWKKKNDKDLFNSRLKSGQEVEKDSSEKEEKTSFRKMVEDFEKEWNS
jgi:hypothetical protein